MPDAASNNVKFPPQKKVSFKQKSELRQLRNYANYGDNFLFKKTELRQLRNYANNGVTFFCSQNLNYANYVITPITVAYFWQEKI